MRLRNRIRLQKMATGVDAAGQPSGAWADYRNCSAAIREPSGTETQQSDDQTTGLALLELTIRTPHDGRIPQPKDRVIYRELGAARTLNIESVARRDDMRRMLRLMCTEVQDG